MNNEKNNSGFQRNSVDMSYVNLSDAGKETKVENMGTSSQDQNLNIDGTESPDISVRKTRPEIRMEPIQSDARDKDRKVKYKILAVFVVIAIILFFFIRSAVINNKYTLLVRNVKVSAQVYIEDSTSASYVSALYTQKIDKIDVTLVELKTRGFITFELTDPRTKEDVSETKVRIRVDNGTLVYEYPIIK